MSDKIKRFILPESEIPTQWYNIQADMKNKPLPFLHPATHKALTPEDLYPIFNEACSQQELNQTDPWIDIPEEVRDMYKYYRCTPLVRAYGLEKACRAGVYNSQLQLIDDAVGFGGIIL